MSELGRVEHTLAGTMPEETPAAVARETGDDRRTIREGPRGAAAAARDAVRSLRQTNRASEFVVSGAGPRQRLFGAGALGAPRGPGQRGCPRGGDLVRRGSDCATLEKL